VVNVADGADVNVGFGAVKFFLCHGYGFYVCFWVFGLG